MSTLKGSLVLLLSLAVCACHAPRAAQEESICKPTFLEIAEAGMWADLGTWRVRFSVALIGCEQDLLEITPAKLKRLQKELVSPVEWSNLLLYSEAPKPEFRRKVAYLLNKELHRELISDVLYHNITMYDHNM